MPVSIACPTCSAKFRAPDAAAGKTVCCPKCQDKIRVPGRESERPSRLTSKRADSPKADRKALWIGSGVAAALGLCLLAGGGVYLLTRPAQTQQAVASAPAVLPAVAPAAVKPVPAVPVADPTAARREAEAKEAAAKQAAKEQADRLAADLAERDRLDAIIREEKEKAQRSKEAFGLLTADEKTIALRVAQELADPKCTELGSGELSDRDKANVAQGFVTEQELRANKAYLEYRLLKQHWAEFFESDVGRAGVARFARSSHAAGGFNGFAGLAGFGAADPDLTAAAVEWYFLDNQATALNAVQLYREYGYDKMPPPPRQYMLDHPVLFRPILKSRAGG